MIHAGASICKELVHQYEQPTKSSKLFMLSEEKLRDVSSLLQGVA